MDCIQITGKQKKKQKMGVKNKKGCQIEKGKKKLPSSKNGCQTEKRKSPQPKEKRKQTILKCLDFLPSLFKRPVCRRPRAPEHCRRRASCDGRVRRALVVGRRSLTCVVCWSADLLPSCSRTSSAVVVGVARARATVRRARDCCWSRRRRNSGMVGSGQPNPCRECFLK